MSMRVEEEEDDDEDSHPVRPSIRSRGVMIPNFRDPNLSIKAFGTNSRSRADSKQLF